MAEQPRRFRALRTLGTFVATVTAVYVGVTAFEKQQPHNLIRKFMRRLPTKVSHNFALFACKYRINPVSTQPDDHNLQSSFFGRLLSNPIGLASGFDCNAEALPGLKDLGFAFIEIGSVTPMAQKVNFINSDGHFVVVQRLQKVLARNDFTAVVGVNLGCNSSSTSPNRDYARGVRTFGPVADFLVVNATTNKKRLTELLTTVNQARVELPQRRNVPVLLKLSPEMTLRGMQQTTAVISQHKCRVDGLIVANATTNKENGLQLIARMYELTRGKVTIIGVGGIASGRDAYEKIQAGASFVQLYTALIEEGPDLVDRIKAELSQLLKEAGYANVREAVGSNYKQYLTNP